MTEPDGTRAYARLQAALEAKEQQRDALASPDGVARLPKDEQDEWDELNEEVATLRAAEDSVRTNTHLP